MCDISPSKVESLDEADLSTTDERTRFITEEGSDDTSNPRSLHRQRTHWVLAIVTSKLLPWTMCVVLVLGLLQGGVVDKAETLDPAGLPPSCAEYHQEQYSPAGEAIRYHDVMFVRGFWGPKKGHESPYQGWPTDEKDKMWYDMYSKGIAIGIDETSHSKLLNSSERVPQAGQTDKFLAGLDVFHQLHCLDALRKSIYPRRYNTSILRREGESEDGREEVVVDYGRWMHLDHCVESLRQSLVCSADVSAYTYEWLDEAKLMAARVGGLHRCRDFEAVREWAFARHVDPGTMRSRVVVEDEDKGGGGEGIRRIVGYEDAFDYRTKPFAPPGWHHTADEL